MNMLKRIFIDGKIPYLMPIKNILYWIAWIAPFSIFFIYFDFGDFGEIGWFALVGVLVIRPLADIFPKVKILRSLVMFRREVGVFAGMMILAHFAGFLIASGNSLVTIFGREGFWDFANPQVWGILGALFAIPVLATSNKRAIAFLKGKWKSVQRLTYLFFIFGGVHIIIVGEESGIIAVVVIGLLWTLAKVGVKI